MILGDLCDRCFLCPMENFLEDRPHAIAERRSSDPTNLVDSHT